MTVCIKPWAASENLGISRLLVNSPLPSIRWDPLEVLHNVGDVHFRPVYSCLRQSLIQQVSRWSHEGATRQIFPISGLFSQEHDRGLR